MKYIRFLFLVFFLWYTEKSAHAAIPAGASADFRFSLGYLVCDYYGGVADDNSTNNTSGLNSCITDAYNNQLVAFLEGCGTYLVNDTLKMYEWIAWNTSQAKPNASPPLNNSILRGTHSCGGSDRPLVKLMTVAATFDDAANPRPMTAVRTFEALNSSAVVGTAPSNPLALPANFRNRDAQCFQNFIEGIDFDTNGHAGAIGVAFPCAQGSGFFNSTITATGSYAGIVGLPGRNSASVNISVTGGQYCFRSASGVPNITYGGTAGVVLVGFTCTSPTVTALRFAEDVPPVIVGFDIAKSSDGIAISATSEVVLTDGQIAMTGSAANDIAIDNVNSRNFYMREVWITGSTNLVRSNGVTLTGSGTWAKVLEYAYNDQFNKDASTTPTVFPTYTVGDGRFEARSIINGSLGAAAVSAVSTANSATAPPSDLISRHVWTTLPSFEDGTYEDPRTYGAIAYTGLDPSDNNTGTISTSALQTAITNAATAGHNRVVIPRGSIYINGNISLGVSTKLIGAGPRVSIIAYANSWAPTSAVPLLTTADDATATTYVGFMSLFIKTQPFANDFMSFLKWRAGKNSMTAALLLDAQFLAAFNSSTNLPVNQARKAVEFTNNGGGRHWISFATENGKSIDRNTGFCIICLTSNTSPTSVYGCNSEAGKWANAPQGVDIQVTTATAGFRCYGIKREGSSAIAKVSASSNVGLFGIGAISTNIGGGLGGGVQVTGASSNVLVANVTTRDMAQAPNGEFMLREAITGQTAFSTVPWPNGIAVYKRGSIDDTPFITPPAPNPPRLLSVTVNLVNTTDICWEIFDSTAMLPASGATGFTFTVNAVSKVPSTVVRQGLNCYRATFAGGTITLNTQVVIVSYTPGNITAGGTGTPAATAFSNQTATNLLSGSTPPVMTQTRFQFYNFFGDLETSPSYFDDENTQLRVHIGSRFRVQVKITNTTTQAASEPLFPYVSIDGAADVALPDTCDSSPIAFADVPALAASAPIDSRILTQDQATFVSGHLMESEGSGIPIIWPAPPSETEISLAIQICPTATLGQTFRIHMYRDGGIAFASYSDATTPYFDVVSQRTRLTFGKVSGGALQ